MKKKIDYKSEDLSRMILEEKLTYCEIGKFYGVSDTAIKKAAIKFNISLPKRRIFPKDFKPYNKGNEIKKNCKFCNSLIKKPTSVQVFCDKSCEMLFKIDSSYSYYLEHQTEFCYVRQMKFIKKHILLEQNKCCKICNSPDNWNDKKLIFILDHIDGNAANNMRNNLRLICPNCDSQLDTFKSKNKNSARTDRYKK